MVEPESMVQRPRLPDAWNVPSVKKVIESAVEVGQFGPQVPKNQRALEGIVTGRGAGMLVAPALGAA